MKRVGVVLSNKWRLDALLGIGGMAWVYSATHRNQSRAAVKLLKPQHAADEEARRRFLREGYVANSVGHPNVRVVLDDDEALGSAYLVMELLNGKSFSDLRTLHGGNLPPRAVLEAMMTVLEVLAVAHAKGIIHRDIKPANVFLTDSGAVKVLDFGIADMREGLRRSSVELTFVGSPAYSAPEQVRADPSEVGPWTDVWGVGATMFRLLSGHNVHEAASVAEHLYAVSSLPPRSLASVAPGLPAALVEIVDRALAFEPGGRFPTATRMRDAMDAALTEAEGLPLVSLLAAVPSLLPPAPEPSTRVAPLDEATERIAPLAVPRLDAHDELASLGISGADVYLLDTIPLIEMIWADGIAQSAELRLLDEFLEQHVRNVNELAEREVVTREHAREFVARFLSQRPPAELLHLLRGLYVETRLSSAPESVRGLRRQAVLDFCLDLGAACVAEYPHGDRQRFCQAEKALFASLVQALSG